MKKILKKFRSTNVLYEDYSMQVTPIAVTGESNQTEVVEAGGGKMFVTKGQKKQTRCLHLAVDARENDPVSKLYKQMGDVLDKARKEGLELPEYKPATTPKGTLLEKTDDYTCAMNEKSGCVEVTLTIDLSRDVDYCDKLYRIYTRISTCLHYNGDFLNRQCRLLAKRGSN